MKYLISCFFALTAFFLLFTSCSGEKKLSKTEYGFMDTVVTATLYGTDYSELENTYDECIKKIRELDMVFSAKNEKSELALVNKSAVNNPVRVSDELFFVMKTALSYCEASDGALDISLGALSRLWGIGTENARVPEKAELEDFMGVSFEMIELDEENKTITLTDEKASIDLGAVAKGYICDEIIKILEKSDINGAIFSVGGNVITYGTKGNSPFTIGFSDASGQGIVGTVKSDGIFTAVTSGGYQRFFIQDAVRYHHILSAQTLYPVKSDIASVSVIGKNSLGADCISTAAFALGFERGSEFVEAKTDYEAIFVLESGEIRTTSGVHLYSFTQNGGAS